MYLWDMEINNRTESPLERICRQAREHDEAVLTNPQNYSRAEVEAARLRTFQRERLHVRDVLRYD